MNFLSKIGGAFKKIGEVLKLVQPLAPIVTGFLPQGVNGKILDVFNGSVAVIGNVEAMFGAAYEGQKTGPEKLKAALPFVAGIIQQSEFMVDKEVIDETMFTAGCQDLVDAVVKITKSVRQLTPEQVNARIQQAQITARAYSGQMPNQVRSLQ